jgi:uncharacterized protein with HEPN domain
MERDESYYLDMLDAARTATEFVAGITFEQFERDEKALSAVLWQVAVIGEAAAKISPNSRRENSGIPWRDITDMRNKLVHDYRRIDLSKVWDTVQNDLPALIRLIEPLVPPEDSC